MFKTRKRKNVYITEKIIKNLDEFVLFLAIRYNFASLINIDIVFISINNIVKLIFINSINVNIDLIKVNSSLTKIINKAITINKINYS